MGDIEEYFPRGGKKPTTQHFKQSSNFLGAPERAEKKKRKPKKKSEADDGYLSDEAVKEVDHSYMNCAVGLSYKTVKPGVLILGRVRQVQETRVHVMLPCKMIGTVMACHISEAYNKILGAYVNDQIDTVLDLSAMFRPGQYVAVKVLEVDGDHLMLSMMPNHVNAGKVHADLHVGCLLQAAVSSVEDHGYVMDIGIPNTRAFLSKKECNPEIELDTGMLTWCTVKSSTSAPPTATVALSTRADALRAGVLKRKQNTGLLPGTGVDFVVDQPLENGIEGHVFGDTTAYVQRQHAASTKDKKPGLGHKVRARVLYVMPTRNTPFLTLRDIFETTYPDLLKEQKFKEGDVIDEAQVIKITGRSIHFKLGRGAVGTMSLRRIVVDEELSDKDVVAKSYPVGSTHKVRILNYNLSDYMYSISDQPAILNEKYFSMDQLTVGDIVTGTVKTVSDSSVVVTVGRMTGFVPHAHLFDSGIFVDPKKATTSKLPKKKFKVGQDVRARVLSVDPHKQALYLTLKPSLLTELEVLSSYEGAQVGKAYTGVIKHIRDDYILVTFFNNVTAFVARNYVTRDPQATLLSAFHVGQIVSCTVLKVDVEAGKMAGSLTTTPFWPEKKRELPQKRKQQTQDSANVPKRLRADSESSDAAGKKKRDKKKKAKDETDGESTRKRKGKNTSVSEEEGQIDSSDSKKKKNKKSKQNEESMETELKQDSKKKKNKKSQDSDEESGIDTQLDKEDRKRKKKKTKKDLTPEESDEIETDLKEDLTLEGLGLINKDTKKKKKKEVSSEESDAIEMDIEVLTPSELGLIDFSDCFTPKHYRKRVVSLLKAIKARTIRLDKIEKKIETRETIGLTPKTKKFHTAMHTDKLIVQERIQKLMDALKIAQDKLKTLGFEQNVDFKKAKRERKVSEQENKEQDLKVDRVKKEKKIQEMKVVEDLEPALEVPSAKDFWSLNPDDLVKEINIEESSSSDDEEKEQPKKKRKKLTVAEKVAKLRSEEERVREMERRAIESESQPRSSDQFERALLASPDCSQLWIAYMAFHLQATEIEKARAVGRKALNTINFREEQERLNVWLALLNVEHRFGTKETQQKTLEEALQMNDTFKVHSKLLDILVETGKHQELAALVDLLLRKYKRDPQNYIICGSACFKLGMVDKGRQVMQKAVAVLDKKEHVSVLVQFALLERSHGAGERAEALFEQVLAVYPRRVDVGCVYADMLLKGGDKDRLRQVMERMTSQNLPAKKMKVLYKKWIEIEEKLGDENEVEKIRQRAMEFIEKAKF